MVEVLLEMEHTTIDGLALTITARYLDADLACLVLEEAEVGQGIVQLLPAGRLGQVIRQFVQTPNVSARPSTLVRRVGRNRKYWASRLCSSRPTSS
jgi:hypothetical protein